MRSLEELVKAYRGGEEDAIDEIVLRCKGIVLNVSRRYFLIGADIEDLYQEGYIGLFKAIKTYDAAKGSFTSYAYVCVNSAALTAVRKYAGTKNKVLNDGLPLSFAWEKASPDNPEDVFIEIESRKVFAKEINKGLSDYESKVLKLYLAGQSYADMEKELKKSGKSIDNTLQRIKKKLRRLYNKTRDSEGE